MARITMFYEMVKADFLERTRRYSFLIILGLVFYLGFMVNSGQVLILLEEYRGVFNSAWIGSLMALVITFFLGLFGFFLVKGTIQRDDRSGVGQIIASTSISKVEYVIGKWISNFAILFALVFILTIASILIQLIHQEEANIQIATLISPIIFIALPMMALVASLAVLFESVLWLRGGFGNVVYFLLYDVMLAAGVFLPEKPWIDVIGLNLVGSSMKESAKAAYPGYGGNLMLGMNSGLAKGTFVWNGLDWTFTLILQRVAWVFVAMGIVLVSAALFNRFNISSRKKTKTKKNLVITESTEEKFTLPDEIQIMTKVEDLDGKRKINQNFIWLVWLEIKLFLKGSKWYWLAGMVAFWIFSAIAPNSGLRNMAYMISAIWPVLLWSRQGVRDNLFHTEPLIYHTPYPVIRQLLSGWLAGVLVTSLLISGVIIGRFFHAESLGLSAWILSTIFIPTFAIFLGSLGSTSKLFEVLYPVLWYLGPFNTQSQLAYLDFLGIHSQAPVNIQPLIFQFGIVVMIGIAIWGRYLKAYKLC